MADDNSSEASYYSEHYTDSHPELIGAPTPIYYQTHNPNGFKRFSMSGDTKFEEAFPGAYETVCTFNAELFAVPYGTRVVNIKTEFPENVHHAIQQRIWTTLKAISERIMKVWESRRDPKEKVFFLFSINGQKQFCGLAELSGPWDPEALVEGWTDPSGGFEGTFPLTWHYVKNVPYARFDGLTHGDKKQPIANMWSGQTISPSEPLGREVVRIYVESCHVANILAWPSGRGEKPGYARLTNGNPQQTQNARAVRGGHADHGGRGGRATDSNWRTKENVGPPAGRIIGEVKDKDSPSITRDMAELTINSAPLPQTDGTFDPIAGPPPRIGQVVSYVVNDNGSLTPLNGNFPVIANPATANPVTHMPGREYFQNSAQDTRSMDDLRGNTRGGPSFGRGNGRAKGKGRTTPVVNYITQHYYGNQQDSQAGLGIHGSQYNLDHNDSAATIKSQRQGGLSTTSSLQHAVSAAVFKPKSAANRSLTQSAVTNNATKYAQQGHQLNNAPSNTSFASQMHDFPPLHAVQSNKSSGPQVQNMASYASFSSNMPTTNPTSYAGMATHGGRDAVPRFSQPYVKQADQRSQDSYPSHFRECDSMAGYVARPVQNNYQQPMGMHYGPQSFRANQPGPFIRNLGEQTPTHLPKHADLQQKTENWVDQNPSKGGFGALAIDAMAVPIAKRATFYHLMADKVEVEKKLGGMSMDDTADYYRTLAKKAEVENMISRLMLGKDEYVEGYTSIAGRGSSEIGSSAASSFKVRAEDGRTLPSVSEAGRPKSGRRAGHNKQSSWDARTKQMAEDVLASPPGSVRAEHHSSDDSMAVGSDGTDVTNPFSDGEGNGGIRLE
ncbi:hypothetical protein LTR56_013177 [Elasticomyces elasticus]|nr:hypothetical protein LTR56_013177 [Elasticomyces elasticus]KAK3656647.1 hypothetical protein LTR22_009626 [Elasticomyces elasticus]KAK4921519.1 hypothetical protein LTR49_010989 [Elasticomyces elasticus]KAK5760207.1 hypothetical protein LTS12_009591 [Elasticomyces elasticus]